MDKCPVTKKSLAPAALLMGAALLLSPAQAQTPALASTPPVTVSDYRGDAAHTGVAAESLATPLSLLWRHTASSTVSALASPVFSGKTVYFVSGSGVSALSADDGATLWQYPADGKPAALFSATPALDGGFLYVADDAGNVVKLDAATGKAAWKVKLDGTLRSSPTLSAGQVFLGSSSGHCYALSAETGQTAWDMTTGGAVTASPIVTGGLVAFSSSDNSVYSFSTRTGRKSWSVPYDSDPSIVPLVYDGRSLLVTAGDTIYSLEPGSGRQRTTIKLPTNVLIPPTPGPDATFIITQSSVLYALEGGGKQRWKVTLDSAPSAPPTLAGAALLVTTLPGTLTAYNAGTGDLLWRYAMQGTATDSQAKPAKVGVAAAPIVAAGTLYVSSDDGTLSAFRRDAIDTVGPELPLLVPASGATVPTDNVTYGAQLLDLGSGINPSTVTLSLDDKPDPLAVYHADVNAVFHTSATPLTEGDHQITVKAADWRGNVTTQSWHFTVRNGAPAGGGRFNPFGRGYPGSGGRNPYAPPPPPLSF